MIPPGVAFWLSFITELTSHPFVIAAFGAGVAYFLAEQRQRWRQQREFQHRAMVEFSEASGAALSTLAEALTADWVGQIERRQMLQFRYLERLDRLIARDAQFFAAFKTKALIDELDQLTKLMNRILKRSVMREVCRRGLKCVSARRRLIVALISAEMRLTSRRRFKAVREELLAEIAELPEALAEDHAESE